MKKTVLALLIVVFSLSTLAKNFEVTCYLKNDFDDWNVYISADTAEFFDNDTTKKLNYWDIQGENWIYYLSDKDESLTFYFNQRSMEGTLVTEWKEDGETKEYDMYCVYEKRSW